MLLQCGRRPALLGRTRHTTRARIHWDDLPPAAHDAVEQHTGPVLKTETAAGGVNSGIAARVHTADASLFVKGVPSNHPQIPTQRREAQVNPHLPSSCPRLLWHVEAGGWDLLGYEHLDARHAAYEPGAPDLPLVADAVIELQQTCAPQGSAVKNAPQRWAGYALGGDTSAFAGHTLLHTDLAPHNVLIAGRAHLIDWAWPTRGAAWIDPAVLVLRLMEAGHSAEDADMWARRFPSWVTAPRGAVELFSTANARAWGEIADNDPQPWKQDMAQLARTWSTYWLTR